MCWPWRSGPSATTRDQSRRPAALRTPRLLSCGRGPGVGVGEFGAVDVAGRGHRKESFQITHEPGVAPTHAVAWTFLYLENRSSNPNSSPSGVSACPPVRPGVPQPRKDEADVVVWPKVADGGDGLVT